MKINVLAILLAVLFSVASTPTMAADPTGPNVVVSVKPLHSLVAGVMEGVAEPQLLITGGGSPHGYVMRPSEAKLLSRADLVVWVGPSLEIFLEKPLATLARQAAQVELEHVLEGQLLTQRVGGSWEAHAHHHHDDGHDEHMAEHDEHHAELEEHHDHDEHHDQAEHHDHEDGEHHEHAEGRIDAHLWLSPPLAGQIVLQVAEGLGRIDPAHQEVYQQNAAKMQQRLSQLHQRLQEKLAPVKTVPYLVFHDAYQYFETAYGLNAVGSITVDPERKPGAQRISELRDKIKTLNVRCVFSEPQFEPRLIATIIEGTDVGNGVLDPLGAELATGPDTYFILLNNLADNLLEGLR